MKRIGQLTSRAVGLGCMNLSHAYGPATPEKQAAQLLNQALDLGYDHLDTATFYGAGANESLLGRAVMHRRREFLLASKCGMYMDAQGKKRISGDPALIRQQCEASLRRLNTDVIDLYYLHRWDKVIPIEETVGELSRLVDEGKIREIGLSEVSAQTLRKAHSVHPIAVVQSEYSLWTRNPEIALLDACRELDTTLVAFSPLGRGMLTGTLKSTDAFTEKDIRRAMPRFDESNFAHNLALIEGLQAQLEEWQQAGLLEMNLAQLSLSWLNSQPVELVSIPGTTNLAHLAENIAASEQSLSAEIVSALSEMIHSANVAGPRYNAATQKEIDTEEF
ncbi:aldo/keto reductase [Vibrio fluvialis]|uniref:aldo/keto reductase n=1 Tax=Vibrio fluvialis TaxID=676 RepID=UPI00192CDE93|nr:aldo/keto reductase [Vibrio fluvialis]MBL4243468.1 aldo/keto reductase [Vibrio fluvialis]MBL4252316.1 aldo/keto reductase [Vibrio fluvialis]MBY8025703.1 aldo/keto reductase [Vibrio fluvialis]MBY8112978.1 aldo/keto reductase [Vibrio fluvialis]MBY8296278.1 aldo/keto reductase [Vibrio fluvialis]